MVASQNHTYLGIPAQILAIPDPAAHIATLLLSGARRGIVISLLDGDEGGEGEIAVGDRVMAHARFAMSRSSGAEARETLAILQEMSDVFLGVG
ncbi:MAG: HypC/HybG/HupF family hydrogenase formation chaperone [Ktedonobacterales bacterium]